MQPRAMPFKFEQSEIDFIVDYLNITHVLHGPLGTDQRGYFYYICEGQSPEGASERLFNKLTLKNITHPLETKKITVDEENEKKEKVKKEVIVYDGTKIQSVFAKLTNTFQQRLSEIDSEKLYTLNNVKTIIEFRDELINNIKNDTGLKEEEVDEDELLKVHDRPISPEASLADAKGDSKKPLCGKHLLHHIIITSYPKENEVTRKAKYNALCAFIGGALVYRLCTDMIEPLSAAKRADSKLWETDPKKKSEYYRLITIQKFISQVAYSAKSAEETLDEVLKERFSKLLHDNFFRKDFLSSSILNGSQEVTFLDFNSLATNIQDLYGNIESSQKSIEFVLLGDIATINFYSRLEGIAQAVLDLDTKHIQLRAQILSKLAILYIDNLLEHGRSKDNSALVNEARNKLIDVICRMLNALYVFLHKLDLEKNRDKNGLIAIKKAFEKLSHLSDSYDFLIKLYTQYSEENLKDRSLVSNVILGALAKKLIVLRCGVYENKKSSLTEEEAIDFYDTTERMYNHYKVSRQIKDNKDEKNSKDDTKTIFKKYRDDYKDFLKKQKKEKSKADKTVPKDDTKGAEKTTPRSTHFDASDKKEKKHRHVKKSVSPDKGKRARSKEKHRSMGFQSSPIEGMKPLDLSTTRNNSNNTAGHTPPPAAASNVVVPPTDLMPRVKSTSAVEGNRVQKEDKEHPKKTTMGNLESFFKVSALFDIRGTSRSNSPNISRQPTPTRSSPLVQRRPTPGTPSRSPGFNRTESLLRLTEAKPAAPKGGIKLTRSRSAGSLLDLINEADKLQQDQGNSLFINNPLSMIEAAQETLYISPSLAPSPKTDSPKASTTTVIASLQGSNPVTPKKSERKEVSESSSPTPSSPKMPMDREEKRQFLLKAGDKNLLNFKTGDEKEKKEKKHRHEKKEEKKGSNIRKRP